MRIKGMLLRLQCFFTGHNWVLLSECSQGSEKAVKKFFSAIMIVMVVWFFIGAAFTYRYLKQEETWIWIGGGVLASLLVLSIERQIILTVGKHSLSLLFRGLLGVGMALLGAVIMDQFILNEDIEKHKVQKTIEEVNRLLPIRTQELQNQLKDIDATIKAKEAERAQLVQENIKKPTVTTGSRTIIQGKTRSGRMGVVGRQIETKTIENPNSEIISRIDDSIKQLWQDKQSREQELRNVKENLHTEIQQKKGFLDEINVVMNLISSSWAAFAVWALFFLIFLSIELFVVVSKWKDEPTDYDFIVDQQMRLRKERALTLYAKENLASK